MSVFEELKRRNVLRVAAAYVVAAWLVIQVVETLFPVFGLSDAAIRVVVIILAIGLVPMVIFAWAFELTSDGLKLDKDVDRSQSITARTGKMLDRVIMVVLALALGYFAFDKFVLSPGRQAAKLATATQEAHQEGRTEALVGSYGDHSIAVLPFVNMSDDASNEYFSDGISEELLNLLAKIPELRVTSRSSAFAFKGEKIDIPEVAKKLNVAHILEGSVRKAGNRVRITTQLIEARSDTHLWSETYDRTLDDIFAVQDDIAAVVVSQLKVTLLGEVPKIRKTDPKAYQLFLEGQYLKRQISIDSLHRAIEAFKQAVEIDPAYVPAWAELADTYIWAWSSDEFSIEERHALADQAIEKAINTDPDYAFAYYVRGISWIFTKNKFQQGIEDFQYALKLDPDNAFLVAAIGKGAFLTGKYDLAITQYQAALAIEPIVPEFYLFLGRAYLSSGRLDDAEASFEKLLSLSPAAYGKFYLWQTLLLKGELEAALAESDTDYRRAVTHYALGNAAVADEALADFIKNADPYSIAMAYGYRGDVDKTFEWLDYMLENSDNYPTFILTETAFRSIHSDPRWEPLLEKLGLLEFWLEMSPDWGLQ